MTELMESAVEEQAVRVMPLVRAKVPLDDFDDVMQDIRISLWISLPGHRGEAAVSTYSYSIAKRRIADYWRRVYREQRAVRALIGAAFPGVPDEPETENGSDWLRPAEKEVFRLLGRGLSNAEIAAALFRSNNTVRSHLKAIYGKLRCNDRVKVAFLARRIFSKEEA